METRAPRKPKLPPVPGWMYTAMNSAVISAVGGAAGYLGRYAWVEAAWHGWAHGPIIAAATSLSSLIAVGLWTFRWRVQAEFKRTEVWTPERRNHERMKLELQKSVS